MCYFHLSRVIKSVIFQGVFVVKGPRKLTWNLKRTPWKRRNIYKPPIFGFHVSFQGCISSYCNSSLNLQVPGEFARHRCRTLSIRGFRAWNSWWNRVLASLKVEAQLGMTCIISGIQVFWLRSDSNGYTWWSHLECCWVGVNYEHLQLFLHLPRSFLWS